MHNRNEHKAFLPPKKNCSLWRYMDLTKLLSLLESRKLLLMRADQFDDPYEGTWSRASFNQLRDQIEEGDMPPDALENFMRVTNFQRQQMYISCWYTSEHESAAMWKLYLQSPEGVAIKTDYDALTEALEKSSLLVHTTMVEYVDYDAVAIPTNNIFFPFVHKRMSFSHENELRAIAWQQQDVNAKQISADATSVAIDIVPSDLIKSIHVSPIAPVWFGELVVQLMARYNLSIPIVRSGLYDRPTY
jgi:hypothetical protein